MRMVRLQDREGCMYIDLESIRAIYRPTPNDVSLKPWAKAAVLLVDGTYLTVKESPDEVYETMKQAEM